jgi:hypothetical protein
MIGTWHRTVMQWLLNKQHARVEWFILVHHASRAVPRVDARRSQALLLRRHELAAAPAGSPGACMHCRLVATLAVAAVLMLAPPAHAQRAVQVSPDGANLLISKPLNGQQWSIVVNFDAQTVAGNVFNFDGSDPQFIYCTIVDPFVLGPADFSGIETVALECKAAEGCTDFPCTPAEWTDLGSVGVIGSFFVPPRTPLRCNLVGPPMCAGTCLSDAHCVPVGNGGCGCVFFDSTPTPRPSATTTPHPQPTFTFSPGGGDGCCKHCTTGIPCGDACISASKTCHTIGGCACF